MKELKDTVDLMLSEDDKDKFKAEIWQLWIRYDKLNGMLDKWDKGELDFTPTCPKSVLNKQIVFMKCYLDVLLDRAENEGIEL